MTEPTTIVTTDGAEVRVQTTTDADHDDLWAAFAAVVAADEGYPQAPDRPVSADGFRAYWLDPARVTVVARQAADGSFVGGYTIKPNGVGRAAHVANAGYIVVPAWRGTRGGRGPGRALVRRGPGLGFDAMQFNFVFDVEPGPSALRAAGVRAGGSVPEVIDGEAVCIYWRRL